MREVNPDHRKNSFDIKGIIDYLIAFVKSPVEKIAHLPDWDWPSIFVVQLTIAISSGFLAGLIKLNIYRMAAGLFLMPFVSTLTSFLLATFFYYYFQFLEGRTEIFRKIFIFVILSSIPFYIFQILSEYFAPISLIGFGFTSLLAVVGLAQSFQMEKKRAYQLVGLLFAMVLVTWIVNRYSSGG